MIYLFDRQKKLQKIIPKKHLNVATQKLELNGLYKLSVEVPLFYETKEGTQYNHKKNIEKAWFAGHYDRQKRFQLYKIHARKVSVKNDGTKVIIADGVHIFFDEAKAMGNIHDRRFRDSEMKPAADAAFNPIGWYVKDYDVTDRADITFYRDSVANARSLIIEKFGVEFDYGLTFDGRKIISKDLYIKKRLGRWTGKRFAYGSNLLSLTQEEDESEVYTAAVGRGRGEESGEGHGPRIEFTDIEWSRDGITKPPGQNYIEIPSATAEYGYYENGEIHPRIASEVVFENTENKRLLADSTYYWLLENCVPKALWKTNVAKADVHDLGDGVGVIYKKANIIKKARVHKMENNLLDHRLSKIILGDYKHFKTDKRQQSITAQLKRNRRDNQIYITQLKNDFDVRYDAQATAIENAYEQAVIDANAETQAAEQRMSTALSEQKTTLEGQISTAKTNAINSANAYSDGIKTTLEGQISTQWTNTTQAINTAKSQAIADATANAQQISDTLLDDPDTQDEVKALSVQGVRADFAVMTTEYLTANIIKNTMLESEVVTSDKLKVDSALVNKLTTDALFANEIKALSVDAAKGNFGDIVAGTADIGFIKTPHLDSEVVTASKLKVDSALVNKLVANTVFADEINTMSLNAVHADLTSVNSEIMQANIIKSEWLDVDTALFDRITADEAFISSLTAKNAFIRDIQNIEINTSQLNIQTIKTEAGNIEGGWRIARADGHVLINNGYPNWSFNGQLVGPNLMTQGVTISGQYYQTYNTDDSNMETWQFVHDTRYVTLTGYAHMYYPSTDTASGVVTLTGWGGLSASATQFVPSGAKDSNNQTEQVFINITLDLGVPDGQRKGLYIRGRVGNSSTALRFRRLLLNWHG